MMARSAETDASGNPILGDIGLYLSKQLKAHFKEVGTPIDLKYIDPTYMVRAIPTIPSDRVYCKVLGQNSVHAAFAGFTGGAVSA
jgi:6-phosphofructokinase 1